MNAELRSVKTGAEQALADAYTAAKATLPGDRKVAALRDAAAARFDAIGLPNRRVEEWKYTDLRALLREARPLAGAPSAAAKSRAMLATRAWRSATLMCGMGRFRRRRASRRTCPIWATSPRG